VPAAQVVFRADSFVALHQAVRTGLGLAIIPCCLGDGDPALQRLPARSDDLTIGLWLLTHQDLSKVTRIRAFIEHMARALAADRARLAGSGPTDRAAASSLG
jgi:DNA-binding transcriptional LysR family regulator